MNERMTVKKLELAKETLESEVEVKISHIEALENTISRKQIEISDLEFQGKNQQTQIEILVLEKTELEAMLKATNKLRVH